MPFQQSSYAGNAWINGSHLETIVPALFRKIKINYERVRLELEDGDFLDLDFLRKRNSKVLVLFHGLEGSTSSSYIKGMARTFFEQGWDVYCMNFRLKLLCAKLHHPAEFPELHNVIHRQYELQFRSCYWRVF